VLDVDEQGARITRQDYACFDDGWMVF